MTGTEAERRSLALLNVVGHTGWRVQIATNAELRARSIPPCPKDRDVFGLTIWKDHLILLDEGYLKDDEQARELVVHEVVHASGGGNCRESNGADSPEFSAMRRIVSDCYTLLFQEQ